MKLRILTASAIIGIVLHIACDTGTDPCGPFPTQFDAQDYSIQLKESTLGAPALDTTATYPYDSLAIRAIPVVEYLYAHDSGYNSFGMPVVYACSPPIAYSIDTLSEMFVVTNVDYDSTFLAGDTLNSILTVDFLDDHQGPMQMSLIEFLNSRPSVKREMLLRLDVPPDQLGLYRFTVYIKHFSGEEFQYITESIMMKP